MLLVISQRFPPKIVQHRSEKIIRQFATRLPALVRQIWNAKNGSELVLVLCTRDYCSQALRGVADVPNTQSCAGQESGAYRCHTCWCHRWVVTPSKKWISASQVRSLSLVSRTSTSTPKLSSKSLTTKDAIGYVALSRGSFYPRRGHKQRTSESPTKDEPSQFKKEQVCKPHKKIMLM